MFIYTCLATIRRLFTATGDPLTYESSLALGPQFMPQNHHHDDAPQVITKFFCVITSRSEEQV
jgi:hypothetical protein